MKSYEYYSQLAPYISGLICQKRLTAIATNSKHICSDTLINSVSKMVMTMAA